MSSPSPHGFPRGSDSPRRSHSFEGRFGRLFRSLPIADFRTEDLLALGSQMVAGSKPKESGIPAGYTYLGQFVAHDLTFDPASSLQRADDPEGLVDYRTPRFDLDCVYGRGLYDQPYLYERDSARLILGERLTKQGPTAHIPDGYDLPRNPGNDIAIIGDPRNDENVIIAQLHSVFMRFHNRIADEVKATRQDFERVQQLVRWHYQWVVLYDFLPRVVDSETYMEVLPHVAGKIKPNKVSRRDPVAPVVPKSNIIQDPPKLHFYRPQHEAFIPIEFSAAGYRFGHSMVRPVYNLNLRRVPLGIIGSNRNETLTGFGRFNPNWLIDWRLFYQTSDGAGPEPQRSLKIDTMLSEPLSDLPFRFLKPPLSLPQRNLIRGMQLGLPSGQAVAQVMGIEPVDDDRLCIGPKRVPIGKIQAFKQNAPLWCYILAEAQHLQDGERLGPVGSRIVIETFVGLMMTDGHSLLRQNPLWRPELVEKGGKFGMAEFIRMATESLDAG